MIHVNAKKFFLMILPFLMYGVSLNCNMIFYKKNQPYPIFSYIDEDIFAEIYLRWEEKMEHPLSGTTKKRNYQTEIYISQFKFENNRVKKVKQSSPIVFDFWIIPESMYVINTKPLTYLFLYGEKHKPYGIENAFGIYFIDSDSISRTISSSEVTTFSDIDYFLPSPDKVHILALSKKNKIQIYKIIERQIDLVREKSLSFALDDKRFISWDPKNFNQIYFYNSNIVYVYNHFNDSMDIAKTFPECIIPGTSFGGNVDMNGNEFSYEQANQEYYFIKLKKFKSFYKKNFIQNPRMVQFSCFE